MQPNISVLTLLSLSLILTSCTQPKNIKAEGNKPTAPIVLPEKPMPEETIDPIGQTPIDENPTQPQPIEKYSRILCETSSPSQLLTFVSNASLSTYPQHIKLYFGNNPNYEQEITNLSSPEILENGPNGMDVIFSGIYENKQSIFQSKIFLAQSFGLSTKIADLYVPINAHLTANINLGLPLRYFATNQNNSNFEVVYSDAQNRKYVYMNSMKQLNPIDLNADQSFMPEFIKNSDWISFLKLNSKGQYGIVLYSFSKKTLVSLPAAISPNFSQLSLKKVNSKFYWLETDTKSVFIRSIDTSLDSRTLQALELPTLPFDKINFQMEVMKLDQKQYLVLNQETYKQSNNQKIKLESGRVILFDITSNRFQSITEINYPDFVYESANRFGISQLMGQGLYFSEPQNKLFIRLRNIDGFLTYHSFDFTNSAWKAHHIFTCGNSSHFEETL